MFRMIINFALLSAFTLTNLPAIEMPIFSQRIYMDEKDLSNDEFGFHNHIGENIWIGMETVHRDSTGLFAYECDVFRSEISTEYEKKWKCPYCHHYWPIGKACGNKDCPSKYKDMK